MTPPSAADIYEVMQATWPPVARFTEGPRTIRDGDGGGKRVSAATADAPVSDSDIALAQAAMIALNQPVLFMIREQDANLDRMLAARDYVVVDPVNLYACPIHILTKTPPQKLSAFTTWPPLEIMRELWAEGAIGPARIAVMNRATGAKTALLARVKSRPAGAAFVAIHHQIAMIHAIEVTNSLRRNGAGINIMRAAAHWAQNQGAGYFSVLVTDANAAANALYSELGMTVVGHYHYRIRQKQ
ncbi:MAG: GNAT family N-acetyltransferase [Paracoccaceae bacterium]